MSTVPTSSGPLQFTPCSEPESKDIHPVKPCSAQGLNLKSGTPKTEHHGVRSGESLLNRSIEVDARPTIKTKNLQTGYKKTRSGCYVCKQRRIKCDKSKPGCDKCRDFGLECVYINTCCTFPSSKWQLVNDGPNFIRQRGRPRKNWTQRGPDCQFIDKGYALQIQTPDSLLDGWKAYDDLINRLTWPQNDVYSSLQNMNGGSLQEVLGIEEQFTLKIMNALVSLRLAQQNLDLRRKFMSISAELCASGIREFAMSLTSITENNGRAIFAASILICIVTLAQGPQPGEYLLFHETGNPTWYHHLKGVRVILDLIGVNQAFSGPFRRFLCQEVHKPAAESFEFPKIRDWSEQFDKLAKLIRANHSDSQSIYLDALSKLRQSFESIWGGPGARFIGHSKYQLAFVWIYQLQDNFVSMIQDKFPVPLIIFAYFSVLLRTLRHLWFVSDWPSHILQGISSALEPAYHEWLEWPKSAAFDIEQGAPSFACLSNQAVKQDV